MNGDFNLTPNFRFFELCATTHKDLAKTNLEEAKKVMGRMYQLAGFAERVRGIIGKPLIINSGFRCVKLNNRVGGVLTSQHCFDTETELLTPNGWKKYNEIKKEDKCFSYNLSTNKIEITDIDDIIIREHNGFMYCAETKDIDYCVTDKHRFLTKTNKYIKKTDRETKSKYTKSLIRPEWQFKTAEQIYMKRSIHKVSGVSASDREDDANLLSLCMAVIADGWLYKKKGCKKYVFGFNLAKERKIKRVLELLKLNDIPYKIRLDNSKSRKELGGLPVYNILVNSTNAEKVVNIIGKNKEIPMYFTLLKPEILKKLILEYTFFDGFFPESDKCNYFSISCIKKHNIDLLQIMCILCGLKGTISKHKITSGFKSNNDFVYSLNIVPKQISKVSEFSHSQIKYNGIVWCIRNKNGTVIARRNGKVIIAGNCLAEAIDIRVSGKSATELFQIIAASDLKYEQLILEKVGSTQWVHVSIGSKKEKILYQNGKYIRC